MPSVGKFINEIRYTGAPVTFTNAYNAATRIDLPIPIDPVPNYGFVGQLGTIKISGDVKDVAAKDLYVTVCYDQGGTEIFFGEELLTISDAVAGGGWGTHYDYRSLIYSRPEDHPQGTVSIFMRTNNGTANVTDVHFIWER